MEIFFKATKEKNEKHFQPTLQVQCWKLLPPILTSFYRKSNLPILFRHQVLLKLSIENQKKQET